MDRSDLALIGRTFEVVLIAVVFIVLIVAIDVAISNQPGSSFDKTYLAKICPEESCGSCLSGDKPNELYCCQALSNETSQCNLLEIVDTIGNMTYFRTNYR